MGLGNEEGMVKRGVGGPWRLDLVQRIEKQEVFEVGHVSHRSALKPQPTAPWSLLLWGPGVQHIACSLFHLPLFCREENFWSSLE